MHPDFADFHNRDLQPDRWNERILLVKKVA